MQPANGAPSSLSQLELCWHTRVEGLDTVAGIRREAVFPFSDLIEGGTYVVNPKRIVDVAAGGSNGREAL